MGSTAVIPATQEVETWRIAVELQLGVKLGRPPSKQTSPVWMPIIPGMWEVQVEGSQ
jgi:hypothetical protein